MIIEVVIITYKVKAVALDFRGYGVVKDLGKVGFIKGLLPGEEANIKITKEKKNFFEGEIIDLITKSKYRTDFTLEYDNNSLIHLNNEKQLEFQVDITLETLLRNGIKDFKINDIITDNKYYNYRNKARFIARSNPYILLGGYKEGTNKFLEMDHLIQAEELINEILIILKEHYLQEKVIYKDLNSVIIRTNKTHAMVIFVTNSSKTIPLILYEPLLKDSRVMSIYHQHLERKNDSYHFNNIKNYKQKFILDNIGKYSFVIYPDSFFQVNRDVANLTYKKIKDYLDIDDIVIDAFAGMSSIGQYISSSVKGVYSIENNTDSVKSAKESIALNNITNIEVVLGDFNKEFTKYQKRATTIIVDPPRAGLSSDVIDKINNSKIRKIIYLSCNLRSLVSNLKQLTNYELREVTPVKMFFQTVEMETLTYLVRKEND